MKKPEKPIAPKKPGRFSKTEPSKTSRIVVWETPPQWAEYIDETDDFNDWPVEKKREAFFEFVDCEYGVNASTDETYCGHDYLALREYTYAELEGEFYSPLYSYAYKEQNLQEIVSKFPPHVDLKDAFLRATACNEWGDDDRTFLEVGYYEPNKKYDKELERYDKEKAAHETAKKAYREAYKKHRERLALYKKQKSAYDEWRAKRIAELEAAGEL